MCSRVHCTNTKTVRVTCKAARIGVGLGPPKQRSPLVSFFVRSQLKTVRHGGGLLGRPRRPDGELR